MSLEIADHLVKNLFGAQVGNQSSLAFAFSLSTEIERQLISQRTKEVLARILENFLMHIN